MTVDHSLTLFILRIPGIYTVSSWIRENHSTGVERHGYFHWHTSRKTLKWSGSVCVHRRVRSSCYPLQRSLEGTAGQRDQEGPRGCVDSTRGVGCRNVMMSSSQRVGVLVSVKVRVEVGNVFPLFCFCCSDVAGLLCLCSWFVWMCVDRIYCQAVVVMGAVVSVFDARVAQW